MKRYVVGVSGGVDSVALLHMLSRLPEHEIIVAHFDHGIREDSAEDAQFVRALAEKLGLVSEVKREELGPEASEELARERRYDFLREVAQKYDARIVTAHHSDDAVETVAINIHRGTGWRGLAVLDSEIVRPLLDTPKSALLSYAKRNNLQWREDSTNASPRYLRNRIRQNAQQLTDDERLQVLALRQHQIVSKKEIDREVARLVGPGPEYSRYFFTHIPSMVALECLRFATRGQLTRPQLERALLAIKTAAPGTSQQAGAGVSLRFSTRNFSL